MSSEKTVKLSQFYHDEFNNLCSTYLKVGELVLTATDCSSHSNGNIGFFVITDHRGIVVSYHHNSLFGDRPKIRYAKRELPYYTIGGKGDFYWRPSPTTPLKQKEIKNRSIKDLPHSRLKRIEFDHFSVRLGKTSAPLLEIRCYEEVGWDHLPVLVFKKEIGDQIYELLVKCLRGEVVPNKSQRDLLMNQLQELAQLRQAGLLSDTEFTVAKTKLLDLDA